MLKLNASQVRQSQRFAREPVDEFEIEERRLELLKDAEDDARVEELEHCTSTPDCQCKDCIAYDESSQL